MTKKEIEFIDKDLQILFFNIVNSKELIDMVTLEDIKNISRHEREQLEDILEAFKTLKEANLLTPENVKIICDHKHPFNINAAFKMLKKDNILTPDNIKIISKNLWPDVIISAFKMLKEENLLTLEIIKIISDHKQSFGIHSAFKMLKKSNILTPGNIKLIINHLFPDIIASAFKTLVTANLLTPGNIRIICDNKKPFVVDFAFKTLKEVNLLTPDNIQFLLNNPEILLPLKLRNRCDGNNLFSILPNHLITQEVFDNLIQICNINKVQNGNINVALEHYIEQLLVRASRDRGEPLLNNSQSTHTTSVHQSSSASAKKLSEYYQDQLNDNEDQVISKIKNYINNLGNSLKEKSAKTCIKRIIQGDIEFYDSSSRVSLKQLIALFHLAVHDTKACTADLEEGQKSLVNALYEIQRGYNLSETGVDDNNEKDRPICMSGAFNKLIEFISPIHQACQMIFMSSETATLKLPIIVKEKTLAYLKNNDLKVINERIWEKVIWPKIKKAVAKAMFSEFSGLYGKGEDDEQFIALVDSGVHIDINKLTEGMAKLSDLSNQGIAGPDANKHLSEVHQPSDKLNGIYGTAHRRC
jgi:hypothetical protein